MASRRAASPGARGPVASGPIAGPTFAERIVAWQRRHGRHDLPWQRTRDAYRIWLSEIMLQQTQVATVLPYYARFLEAFPDVRALAAAPLERVLALWSGLGYYRRAHQLHAAARHIAEVHGGTFPSALDAIVALPGIGRSTAAAIAAFAFGARAPILDGNVKRVLARHRGIEGFPGHAKVEAALWRCAEELLPQREVAAYTQGLMDLGATRCLRTQPRCGDCPVADDCIARRTGRTHALPSPRPLRVLPRRAIQVLLIERGGTILFEKRPPTGIWAGLWSLPELAVEADVATHCADRFGLAAHTVEVMPALAHAFTHYRLTLLPRRVVVAGHGLAHVAEPGFTWLAPEHALAAAIPTPVRTLLRVGTPP